MGTGSKLYHNGMEVTTSVHFKHQRMLRGVKGFRYEDLEHAEKYKCGCGTEAFQKNGSSCCEVVCDDDANDDNGGNDV